MINTKNKTRSKEKRKYLNSSSGSTSLAGMWERMREMMSDIQVIIGDNDWEYIVIYSIFNNKLIIQFEKHVMIRPKKIIIYKIG